MTKITTTFHSKLGRKVQLTVQVEQEDIDDLLDADKAGEKAGAIFIAYCEGLSRADGRRY